MAEIIGAVASGIALAQVAIQLLRCAEELRTLSRSIHNAPENLQSTLNNIEAVGQIFSSIDTFDECAFPVQIWCLLQSNLLNCEATASDLKALATKLILKLNKTSKLHFVYLIDVHLSKEEMKELTARLESTKSSLQLAMTCVTMHMIHNLTMTKNKPKGPRESFQTLLPDSQTQAAPEVASLTPLRPRQKKAASIDDPLIYQKRQCSLNRCCCTCHDNTFLIQGGGWSVKLPSLWGWKPCSKLSCQNSKNASIWISLTKVGIPWAVKASLNFMFSSHQSSISPSLDFQRVVKNTSPGFELLWKLETGQLRDWVKARHDLVKLFDSGEASPRDVDPNGRTWLEKILNFNGTWWWIDKKIQLSLSSLLIQMGTQINTPRLLYQCASWEDEGPRLALLDELISYGFDTSQIEPPAFSHWPAPCPRGSYGSDPFFVEWISKNLQVSPGFAGMNPLLEAILTESTDEVQRLLTKIPVNDQDNLLGQSSLHLAVYRPHHMEILLKSGADVDARDKYGITPLMYAAAMGETQVAIRLIDCGANPLITALHHWNFFGFAIARQKLNTIEHVLSHVHYSAKLVIFNVRDFLGLGLAVFAHTRSLDWERKFKQIQTLLEWGANPNILCYDPYGRASGTILHKISDMRIIKSIVEHGFTLFNHVDHAGDHVLLSSSLMCNPDLMELLITRGSLVNHQNHKGHTVLHTMAQFMRGLSSKSNFYFHDERTHIIDYVKQLLRRKSNSCSEDKCRCACSRSGCTPSSLILKEHPSSLSIRQDIWAIEFYAMVEEESGFETAKHCILDMLRFIKFEELELTHTCRQETSFIEYAFGSGDETIDDDEVEEILDEEQELANTLEQDMLAIENLPRDDLEQLLLRTIQRRKWDRELEMNSQFIPPIDRQEASSNLIYKVDNWRDEFIVKRRDGITAPAYSDNFTPDTVGVDEYSSWVEYIHAKHQNQNEPDDEWYKKRIGWISSIRSMYEQAAREGPSEEESISKERILLIPDI